jgi:DNA-binding NtrC family response regulator
MSNKILVVDDDAAARRMLFLLLETTAEILQAASGEEALRLVAEERPRLMLLDMTMPGMSGLDVLKAVRASAPATTVIMLTGAVDVELAQRSLELGAAEYVTKPFDLPRLKEKVKRIMAIVKGDDRNSHGLPWRIGSPESPAVPAAGPIAPTIEAVSRWEGEGGNPATSGEPMAAPTPDAALKLPLVKPSSEANPVEIK